MFHPLAAAPVLVLLAAVLCAEETHTVEPDRFEVQVSYSGVFEAIVSAPVSVVPEVWTSFEVVEAVAHGARVEEGATVVTFDTTDLDEGIRDLVHKTSLAALAFEKARAELQILEQTSELDLAAGARSQRIAERDLERYREKERPLNVRGAHESLRASEYSLEYSQEELEQLQQMYEADDLTEETEEIILTRQRRAVEFAKSRLERARELHDKTTTETIPRREEDLVTRAQRAGIEHRRSSLVQPLEQEKKRLAVAALERKLQRGMEDLERHRRDRELMVVTAPASGIVYYGAIHAGKIADASSIGQKQLRKGGKVSAREVFMTIVAEGPLGVRAHIEEKLVADIKEGVTGVARPTAFPERELPVRVDEVMLVPIASGKFDCPARVAEDADTRFIMPGMSCKVDCIVYERSDALTVPAKAVRGEGDERHVIVLRDGDVRDRREVEIGRAAGGKIEILSGIVAGDVIALPE